MRAKDGEVDEEEFAFANLRTVSESLPFGLVADGGDAADDVARLVPGLHKDVVGVLFVVEGFGSEGEEGFSRL